jgi:hypothetical protein
VKLQSVLLKQFRELAAEVVAEDRAEPLDGREESMRRINPSGTIEGKTASANDVVYVGMTLEVLSSRTEHAEESDVGSQVLGIAC